MKKVKSLSESRFLTLFFTTVSLCFLAAAFLLPDRASAFSGLWKIMTGICRVPNNCFSLGGISATFLNMGIVGLLCSAMCFLPGAKPDNATTLGFFLAVGFGAWCMNPVNMLPSILGVALYCLVKKEPLGRQINALLFSTGIAPLISDLLFRYPGTEYAGFSWLGLALALFVGCIIGFFLPAGMTHAPSIHKGFNHYSAAVPIGTTAFFLRAVLYNVLLGWKIEEVSNLPAMSPLDATAQTVCNLFCCILFALCIIFSLLMGCTPRQYHLLIKDSGKGVSFTGKYGNAPFLMNVGVFGLMIVAYFNLAGLIDGSDVWTGLTFGIAFCMLATCNSGSHPGNVWPIMAGYMLASFLFGWLFKLLGGETYALTIGAQSILIGLCFANGLSPVSGVYGFGYGILAGGLHYLLVTAVPDLHGGFCLYNGGFTAGVVCLLLVPQLEKFCKTKEERQLIKVAE